MFLMCRYQLIKEWNIIFINTFLHAPVIALCALHNQRELDFVCRCECKFYA